MDLSSLLSYLSGFAVLAGIYAVFALGLNVHWGATGLLNLGITAFFALGSYTAALLSTPSPDPRQFEDFKFGDDLPALLGPLDLGIDLWFFLSRDGVWSNRAGNWIRHSTTAGRLPGRNHAGHSGGNPANFS